MYIYAEALHNFTSAHATSTLKTHTVPMQQATKNLKHISLQLYGIF